MLIISSFSQKYLEEENLSISIWMYIIMCYGLNLTGKESDSKIQESLSDLKSRKKSFNAKFYDFLEN